MPLVIGGEKRSGLNGTIIAYRTKERRHHPDGHLGKDSFWSIIAYRTRLTAGLFGLSLCLTAASSLVLHFLSQLASRTTTIIFLGF
jgi:hypothetical protein